MVHRQAGTVGKDVERSLIQVLDGFGVCFPLHSTMSIYVDIEYLKLLLKKDSVGKLRETEVGEWRARYIPSTEDNLRPLDKKRCLTSLVQMS